MKIMSGGTKNVVSVSNVDICNALQHRKYTEENTLFLIVSDQQSYIKDKTHKPIATSLSRRQDRYVCRAFEES